MTPLEKAARALAIAFVADLEPHEMIMSQEQYVDQNWREWLPDIRAVIEAIREPSEVMVKATEPIDGEATAKAVWHMMLLYMLEEGA